MKHSLRLPDGTWISSGTGGEPAISQVQVLQSVNTGTELNPGSVCAAMAEVRLFVPEAGVSVQAGQTVELYRENGGSPQKIGCFILEKPTRLSAHTMLFRGFDPVIRLDRDLSGWLDSVQDWPVSLGELARRVCTACGLTLQPGPIPNSGLFVQKPESTGMTGRKLMEWIGQAAGAFVRADPDGRIMLGRYRDSGITVGPGGSTYYFGGTLRYEDYTAEPVAGVQLRLGAGEKGYLWPEYPEDANTLILCGNPLIPVEEASKAVLEVIKAGHPGPYRPCRLSLPGDTALEPGDRFSVTDPEGNTFETLVMTKQVKGTRCSIECTGSRTRQDSSAFYGKPRSQLEAEARLAAQLQAQKILDSETQLEVLNKLTDGGRNQGLYLADGQLYVNASCIRSGVLDAGTVRVINLIAEALSSRKDGAVLKVSGARMELSNEKGACVSLQYVSQGMPILYMDDNAPGWSDHAELTPHMMKLGGSSGKPAFQVLITEGRSTVYTDSMNPGKTVLFEGHLPVGSTVTVTGSCRYDLFAVQLGTQSECWSTPVLAMRLGDQIRGTGGYCGTKTAAKELHFLTVQANGDSWKLLDAGYHSLSLSGVLSAGTRLQIRRIVGIV